MNRLIKAQSELENHPIYRCLGDIKSLRIFMETHVFAVWDFMALLKSLQQKMTCVEVPWRPSPYPAEMARLVNQIVLGEESDVDQDGQATSHFELYVKAMKEVGADTRQINGFLHAKDSAMIPLAARDFVENNLRIAQSGHVVEIAAYFLYGREKLVPHMFRPIVDALNKEGIEAPSFIYYLKRHIEVDGDEHGPLAEHGLGQLVGDDTHLREMAESAGVNSLMARKNLWDQLTQQIQRS